MRARLTFYILGYRLLSCNRSFLTISFFMNTSIGHYFGIDQRRTLLLFCNIISRKHSHSLSISLLAFHRTLMESTTTNTITIALFPTHNSYVYYANVPILLIMFMIDKERMMTMPSFLVNLSMLH